MTAVAEAVYFKCIYFKRLFISKSFWKPNEDLCLVLLHMMKRFSKAHHRHMVCIFKLYCTALGLRSSSNVVYILTQVALILSSEQSHLSPMWCFEQLYFPRAWDFCKVCFLSAACRIFQETNGKRVCFANGKTGQPKMKLNCFQSRRLT